jgi:myo-inositol-1(or 4)-monophosphatase
MSRVGPAEEGVIPELAALAVALATEGAAVLTDQVTRTDLTASTKSSPSDWVTEVDRQVEALLVERIVARRPDDGIVGEEGADRPARSGVRWLLDPIDGTTNFMHRLPGYAVSVAAEVGGVVQVGVVADPARGHLYTATRGGGAFCNGRPIGVRAVADLASAVVATGFSYDGPRRQRQLGIINQILPAIGDIRRLGAASTDLCLVAAGQLAGYFEHGLNIWDYAAGALVAAEAGAVVRLPDPSTLPGDELVYAFAPGIAEAMAALLRDAGAFAGAAEG